MSTREPLIYPMPPGYELGMLVQQIAEQDEPRAVILDFLQRTILVHPSSEDGSDASEFTADSLAFLLTSVELEHTDSSFQEALVEARSPNLVSLWVCVNPEHKETLNYDGEVLWTKLVETGYALMVTKLSDQKWKIVGASL